jgi:chromosome segregation ATPase
MNDNELQEIKERVQRLEPAFNKDFPTDRELVEMALEDMPKLVGEIEAQRDTLKWAKDEIEAKDRENEHLKHLRGKKNEAISEMEAEIDQIKEMLDACAEQRDAATNDIEHLLDQIETKEQEKEGVKTDWYDMKKENERLREELELLTEIVRGSDNVDQSNREYDRLKGEFDRLKGGGETEIK